MVRGREEERCSYVVPIEAHHASEELRKLADSFLPLARSGAEIVVVDGTDPVTFAEHDRILRWVCRHVAAGPERFRDDGTLDVIDAAVDFSSCDRVIIATADHRCTSENLEELRALLDEHEVIVPQQYLEPLPLSARVEAGRMLLHRATQSTPPGPVICAMRRRAVEYARRERDGRAELDPVSQLVFQGLDVCHAPDLFVRRLPPAAGSWWSGRLREASADFPLAAKSTMFLAFLPLLFVALLVGGGALAAGYAGAVAFAAVGVAVRGRLGAASFFPLSTCLFAPLWILERSVSAYWIAAGRLRSVVRKDGAETAAPGEAPRVLRPVRGRSSGL